MQITANASYKGEPVGGTVGKVENLLALRGRQLDILSLQVMSIESVDDINYLVTQLNGILQCFSLGNLSGIQYPSETDPDREEQKDEGHAVPTPDADWPFVEGDQVMLKSGGPILTVTTVTNGWIDCIYYDDNHQLFEQGFGWAVVYKLT